MNQSPIVHILDDDEEVRNSIAFVVRSMGLASKCYGSAREFFDSYDDAEQGCLVLDVRMPMMGGIEVQEKLAAEGRNLPIIMITGHGDLGMRELAMTRGAVDFLEKPYPPDQFKNCVRRALELDED